MSEEQHSDQKKIDTAKVDISVGDILRKARHEYKLTVEQVEQHLRIKAAYIEAMENGEWSKLPGQAYVSSFTRSYADFLGLDGDKMTALLREQTGRKKTRPQYIFPATPQDQKLPNMTWIAGSGIVLVILIALWGGFSSRESAQNVPQIPAELETQLSIPKPEVAGADPAASTPQTVVPALPEEPVQPLILKAEEDVWLEVKDNKGQSIFSRVLSKGQEYWVPKDLTGLRMTTGNAGGLTLIVDGKTAPPIGKLGEVKRDIPLNLDELRKNLKPISE